MPTILRIPSVLRPSCGGASEVSLAAASVQEVLEQLERCYPTLYIQVCDETGALRQHINLFVNSSLVRRDQDFHKSLAANDVVSIFQAVSGG